ncbi:11613_t:CDS:2, partial [Racocetra fulgida]
DPQTADLFWKNIEKEKEIIRRRQEELIRNNTEKDALKLLETARTEKTKEILNSLKRKSEDISSAKKRYKLPGDSEYYECSDSGESDTESINEVHDDEEIKNLSQDETDIRNKLLKILTANKEKDKRAGKDFMKSIFLNNILDLSDNETYKQIKKSLSKDQSSWLEEVLQKKTWKPTPEYTQYINQFTEEACTRNEIPTIARRSFVSLRFDPYFHEAHDIAQHILTHLIEQITPDTKNNKFDGLYKVISTTGNNQVIIIIEFSPVNKTITNVMENNNIYVISVEDTPQKKKSNKNKPLSKSPSPDSSRPSSPSPGSTSSGRDLMRYLDSSVHEKIDLNDLENTH